MEDFSLLCTERMWLLRWATVEQTRPHWIWDTIHGKTSIYFLTDVKQSYTKPRTTRVYQMKMFNVKNYMFHCHLKLIRGSKITLKRKKAQILLSGRSCLYINPSPNAGGEGWLGLGCVLRLAPSVLREQSGPTWPWKPSQSRSYRKKDFHCGVRFCPPLAQNPRVGPTEGKAEGGGRSICPAFALVLNYSKCAYIKAHL